MQGVLKGTVGTPFQTGVGGVALAAGGYSLANAAASGNPAATAVLGVTLMTLGSTTAASIPAQYGWNRDGSMAKGGGARAARWATYTLAAPFAGPEMVLRGLTKTTSAGLNRANNSFRRALNTVVNP